MKLTMESALLAEDLAEEPTRRMRIEELEATLASLHRSSSRSMRVARDVSERAKVRR